jgi:hypothetical protein
LFSVILIGVRLCLFSRKHLASMFAGGVGDLFAREHSGDLFDTLRFVEFADIDSCPFALDGFFDTS